MTLARITLTLFICSLSLVQKGSLRPRPPLQIPGIQRITVMVDGHRGFIFQPAHATQWVWFAPTLDSEPLPGETHRWMIEQLIHRGIAVAGIDIGESYGSQAGRDIYQAFYARLVSQYGLSSKPCLLAQSRGGLMLYGWASEHAEDVTCIAGIYPVLNLASWPPADSKYFSKASAAYALEPSDFMTERASLSPLNHLGPITAQHIPILHLHGDADTTVPMSMNSAELIKDDPDAHLIVIPGKGHEEVSEFFQSKELVDFLAQSLQSHQTLATSAPIH